MICKFQLPDPPTNCCGQGCANCVWIEYAHKILPMLEGGSDAVKNVILKHIDDPNMKAFLNMELRNLEKRKKK